jgi:hypothetical protein
MDVVVNQIVQLGLNTACNRSRSDLDPVTKRNTLDFLRKVLDVPLRRLYYCGDLSSRRVWVEMLDLTVARACETLRLLPRFPGFRLDAPPPAKLTPPPKRDYLVEVFLGAGMVKPRWWDVGYAVKHLAHSRLHLHDLAGRQARLEVALTTYFRLRSVRGFCHVHMKTEMLEFDVGSYTAGADVRLGIMFFPGTLLNDRFNFGGFVAHLGPMNNFVVAFENGEVLYLDPFGCGQEAAARLEFFAREMQLKMEQELLVRGVDPGCNWSPRNVTLVAHPNFGTRSFLMSRRELALLTEADENYSRKCGHEPRATFYASNFFGGGKSCVQVIPPTFTGWNNGGLLLNYVDDVRGFCFFYFWAESGHWESLAFCPNNDDYLEEARRVISAWMKERTFQEGPSRIKTEFI